MADILIIWDRNYNKLIDLIGYQTKRLKNNEVNIHAFVAGRIADKDNPRDLPWVQKHECLTDAEDSAEAHLIAYIFKQYTKSNEEKVNEEMEYAERKDIILVQTKPGQHEELVMLLEGMQEFASRYVARIYNIVEDFEILNGQNGMPGRRNVHECNNSIKKERFSRSTNFQNLKREAHHFRKTTYPPLYITGDKGQETNQSRKLTYPNFFDTDYHRRETSVPRKKSDDSEIGSDKPFANRNNTIEDCIEDFGANAEKHNLCDRCLNGVARLEERVALSTRRTWPNSRNGRLQHDEAFKVCGICMQRFRCCFGTMHEVTGARLLTPNSLESTSDEIHVAKKVEVVETLSNESSDSNKTLPKRISMKQNYTPWNVEMDLKCNCYDKHVCKRCFMEEIIGRMQRGENSSSEKARQIQYGRLLAVQRLHKERPESSPAMFHGTKGRNEKNKTNEGGHVQSRKDTNEFKVEEGKNNNEMKPKSSAMISNDNESRSSNILGAASTLDTNIDPTQQQSKEINDLNDIVAQKTEGDFESGDDKTFQDKLEELLVRLAKANPESEDQEKVGNEFYEKREFKNSGGENMGKRSKDKSNINKPNIHKTTEDVEKVQNDEELNNLSKNTSPTSRINSHPFDFDQFNSMDMADKSTEEKTGRLQNRGQMYNKEFDYGIFDILDKDGERRNDSGMAKRGKAQLKRGTLPIENGDDVCRFCPERKFKSAYVLKTHMKNTHKKCNCPCGEYFKTREDYLVHFYKLFPLACFLERKCPERFRSLYFQAVHHREKHFSDRPFYCVLCFDAEGGSKSRPKASFKDIISLRIHAESMEHDPNDMFLISSQSEADENALPWSMKCTGIDFC